MKSASVDSPRLLQVVEAPIHAEAIDLSNTPREPRSTSGYFTRSTIGTVCTDAVQRHHTYLVCGICLWEMG